MCGAATITVAEVEELVSVGELDPNHIHIPGIFVQRIFRGKQYEKRIEQKPLDKEVNYVRQEWNCKKNCKRSTRRLLCKPWDWDSNSGC